MGRIRIGVIGGGTIAQVEHVPNLLFLKDKFDLVGVCDPSASTRRFMQESHGIKGFAQPSELIESGLDAIVIASPDALHKEHVLAAFAKGLHVFCEKPLCYGTQDIAELIKARDAAKRVLQVGYMKRFDPAYEAALNLLPVSADKLRQVVVEVVDADAWPFVMQHKTHRASDVAADLINSSRAKQREQALRAVGTALDDVSLRGFCSAYSSSIVHDVNAVHGLLDHMNVPKGEVVGASLFAGGTGGQGTVSLLGGQALWTMSHLSVEKLPHYSERIALHFDDFGLELEFPSPYLNHQPTRLTVRRGNGEKLSAETMNAGYKEAFVEEMVGFHAAITEGTPVRNTAEQAARDMELLCELTRWQAQSRKGLAA